MHKYSSRILRGDRESVMQDIKDSILNEEKHVLVTANSEIFVNASESKDLETLLLDENTNIVIDGIAALAAFKKMKLQNITKIPGIEIVQELLLFANEKALKIAIIGGSKESSKNIENYIKNELSNVDLVGVSDGYIKEKNQVMESFSKLKPDIILVALGVPAQEQLIKESFSTFSKGLFIGCGGSLDVIGGTKRRAPKFFRVTSTEWLYRIIREPKRTGRFFRTNIKFFKLSKLDDIDNV